MNWGAVIVSDGAVIVYGLGPNNVCLPATIYPDMSTAIDDISKKLGMHPSAVDEVNGKASWKIHYDLKSEGKDPNKCEECGHDPGCVDSCKTCDNFAPHPLLNIFTSYYDGCGECSAIVARYMTWGQKLFSFDLD
jgi:hypothetical protein